MAHFRGSERRTLTMIYIYMIISRLFEEGDFVREKLAGTREA
jgi:hypothetical protein